MAVELVAGGNSGKLASSEDGVTWTQRTSGHGTNPVQGVAYSPDLDLWVAVGYQKITYSSDGITWTAATTTPAVWFRTAGWSPDLGIFVAAGDGGQLYTSTDGDTWTSRTTSVGTDSIGDVAWSADLGLFVIVTANGNLATSPDGSTWTNRTSGFGGSQIFVVEWSADLGLFVIAGAAAKLATSPDGINWTARTSGFNALSSGQIISGTWSPTEGKFLVGGVSDQASESSNGTTWSYTFGEIGGTWSSASLTALAYSVPLGLFVAVSNNGKLATSPDAGTWTVRTSSFGSTYINAVAARPGAAAPPVTLRPTVGYIGLG